MHTEQDEERYREKTEREAERKHPYDKHTLRIFVLWQHFHINTFQRCVCLVLCVYISGWMIVQSSLETRQQLWHKQHFFFSSCLTPSRFFQNGLYQFLRQSFPTFHFSLGLNSYPFPVTLSLSLSLCQIFSSHLPFVLISSPAVIWRFQLGASTLLCHSSSSRLFFFLHVSSSIDSQSLHPYQSNSPVCSSASYHLHSFTSPPFYYWCLSKKRCIQI